MKKTTICALALRGLLARNSGRINNTEAPVVPIKLAITAPIPMIAVLERGVPLSEPLI